MSVRAGQQAAKVAGGAHLLSNSQALLDDRLAPAYPQHM